MSFISGLFSGSKGAGFEAKGATEDQANTAYGQTQDAIGKQQQFVDAVNAANGVGNQSQVFNKLGDIANGVGPNPAQAMLAQATGANVANQAALMAGQRGTSANAGLLARQAAQQGAGIQQNAVGQGATMQANQSLGALQQQGQIAGQQVANQAGAIQGLNAAAQGQQSNLLGSIGGQNSANGAVAQQNAKGQGNLFSGVTGAIGSVMGLAEGGAVPDKRAFAQAVQARPQMMATGGPAMPMPMVAQPMAPMMPATAVAPQPVVMAPAAPQVARPMSAAAQAMAPQANEDAAMQGAGANLAKIGGALVKGAGHAVADQVYNGFAKGGNVGGKMKQGGKVPGKPAVGGAQNSYANDTVSAKLSPGEIVLPRSVTQSSDPVKNAAAFVQAVMAKQGRR